MPAGVKTEKVAETMLATYKKLRSKLDEVKGKLGNEKYTKFERQLKQLPDNVLKKLDNDPELLEAIAKRSLDDPEFFKAVQKGDLNKLDELRVTSKVFTDLVAHRREHILNRHRYGTGKPGKTEFPMNWSDDKIIDNVNKIANSVNTPGGIGPYNAPYKIGTIDGIKVRVDFYPPNHPQYAGKVSTAYPINATPNL